VLQFLQASEQRAAKIGQAQEESRKTPPRGGRKAMQGERLNADKFLKGDIAYEEKQI